jgi:flagellar biosynthesis/type III secretory pathway protein FliH
MQEFYDEGYEDGYRDGIDKFTEELKNCFCISKHYLDIMNLIDNIARETKEGV